MAAMLWRAVITRVFLAEVSVGDDHDLYRSWYDPFLVLSGFVIHYNYCRTIPEKGGVRAFAVARFARLYPLYIVLFIIDFAYTGLAGRGACGRAGETGHLLALANYVTLTQSWYYAVICKASLIYQYGPVAAVSWSISVEAFFYVAYVGIAKLIARRKWRVRRIVGLLAASYLVVVIYLFGCAFLQPEIDRAGFASLVRSRRSTPAMTDSLLRWLLYFNPVARLGEFFLGMAAAHLFWTENRVWRLFNPRRLPCSRLRLLWERWQFTFSSMTWSHRIASRLAGLLPRSMHQRWQP